MHDLAHPVYIPSRGRPDPKQSTVCKLLEEDGIEFHIVVEEQDVAAYAETYGEERLLILAKRDQGIAYSRTFIKRHAIHTGASHHWQLDDNVNGFWHIPHRRRASDPGSHFTLCSPSYALSAVELFVARYSNVGISGLRTTIWGWSQAKPEKPFEVNKQPYSVVLVNNATPYEWRSDTDGQEDTDYALQNLVGGWCTILFNAFQFSKPGTGTTGGGLTDRTYADDGRLRKSQAIVSRWPGLFSIRYNRWGRASAVSRKAWTSFPQRPIRRPE